MTLYRGQYRVESARLKHWDYRSPGWYFITVCTAGRRLVFGNIVDGQMAHSPLGSIAEAQLLGVPVHYSNVLLDTFVVMPNHIHAIVVVEGRHRYSPNVGLEESRVLKVRPDGMPMPPRAGSLSAIVRSYKAGVTRWSLANGFSDFRWQPRFHDELLRSNPSVNAVRDYIRNNPMNWLEDELYTES